MSLARAQQRLRPNFWFNLGVMYNSNMFYEVVPEGKVEGLTYDFDDSLLPGQIVLVPVGRRSVPGVVVKKVAQPEFKTKSILKVLYSKPLPEHLLKVIWFLHDYYLASSGQAVSLILPRGVQKKRRKTEQMFGLADSDNSSALEPTRPPVFTGGSFCRRRLVAGEHALRMRIILTA